MSKQLDRIEQRLEEVTSLVGGIAWYFEEAMDYLAVIDEEILLIEEKLGIPSSRAKGSPPPHHHRGPAIDRAPDPAPEG